MVIRLKKSVLFSLCALLLMITGGIGLRVLSAPSREKADKGVFLPVLMYHHFLPESGHLGKYVITPQAFENDLLHLLSLGYHTIGAQELLDFVDNGAPLPEKPVLITVDDGYYSFYKYIFPILKKHSCKAVLSIIGYYSELYSQNGESNPVYSHVTFEEIREMAESGLVEIGNHSYHMHALQGRYGIRKKSGENAAQYLQAVTEDTRKCQTLLSENCGITPILYTYPFGFHSKESDALICKLGFRASLICEERVNYITREHDCLMNLCRYNRPHGIEFSSFWKKIEQKMSE